MNRRYLLRSLNVLSAAVSWLALLQEEGRSLDGFLLVTFLQRFSFKRRGCAFFFVVDSRSMSSFSWGDGYIIPVLA